LVVNLIELKGATLIKSGGGTGPMKPGNRSRRQWEGRRCQFLQNVKFWEIRGVKVLSINLFSPERFYFLYFAKEEIPEEVLVSWVLKKRTRKLTPESREGKLLL
jgi:hypothetical protein